METIQSYLDNMFKGLPTNTKVKEAKNELHAMMEDKYNELKNEGKSENEAVGIVISQFGNLDELSETLGITEEYNNKEVLRTVEIDEAKAYVNNVESNGSKIANGVMAIIMTTALIVLLEGLVQKEIITDGLRNIFSISFLLLVVAVAVYFFITAGSDTEKYEYLEKEPFDISKETQNFVEKYREDLSFFKKVARNVMAIILAVIPIIVVSQIDDSDFYTLFAVAFLLFVVAISTRSFIYNGMKQETTEVLLQENEFNRETKKYSSLIDKIGGIYWPIIVLAYLATSFLTKRWDISWIIFPIAGIIFAIISAIVTNTFSKDDK